MPYSNPSRTPARPPLLSKLCSASPRRSWSHDSHRSALEKTARRLELHCTAKPTLRRAWNTVSRHTSLPPATLVSGGCVPALARSSKSSRVWAGEPRRVPCSICRAAWCTQPACHLRRAPALPRPSHPCVEESTFTFSTARGSPAEASSVGCLWCNLCSGKEEGIEANLQEFQDFDEFED
ncbi:uncharacterized protein [Zea mays]|uniref:uncharacterized protein n=1 Tax=Zea mays TaxID=4577 RepID=UPI00165224E4|nr:uncharacterized protein LOC118476162 [Zea mays]